MFEGIRINNPNFKIIAGPFGWGENISLKREIILENPGLNESGDIRKKNITGKATHLMISREKYVFCQFVSSKTPGEERYIIGHYKGRVTSNRYVCLYPICVFENGEIKNNFKMLKSDSIIPSAFEISGNFASVRIFARNVQLGDEFSWEVPLLSECFYRIEERDGLKIKVPNIAYFKV